MAPPEVFRFDRAIVRQPGVSVANGLRAGGGEAPSFEDLAQEHARYVEALIEAGLQVTVLPPLEDFADSVFVEDPALVFTEAAILLRPGAATRAGEVAQLAPALRQEFAMVLTIDDGTVDGGDIMVTPAEVIIGLSHRTNEAGAACLARALAQIGRRSRIAATPDGVLHFKSDSSLVDEETVLVTSTLADAEVFDGFRKLVVSEDEPGSANALRVNDRVMVGADYPHTIDMLERHGLATCALKVREVAKVDAGLSCMSLRWRKPGP